MPSPILFFDEADALFGKRGETRNALDRFANQETAFLLQRIETFDGIAILAYNLRQNIDEAFARRFESMIHFPLPRVDERLRLRRQGFSSAARFDASVDFDAIARDHVLSGGAIMNAVRAASLAVPMAAVRSRAPTCSRRSAANSPRRGVTDERERRLR